MNMKEIVVEGSPIITHSRPYICEEDICVVSDQLATGSLSRGETVAEFESKVAKYLGLLGGVATSSGSAALLLSLKALGIGLGDEVIIPSYVCKSVFDAVILSEATPVLADVDYRWCLTEKTIIPHLTESTKAIIVVHTFGVAADIEPITDLGVPIIEDCAQAFGNNKSSRMLGTYGQICICSFHATKLLCTGEGGMALTDNQQIYKAMQSYNDDCNGRLRLSAFIPMSDMQAALGLSQLSRYEDMLLRRKKIAEMYFDSLRPLSINLPKHVRDSSIFYRFPIRTALPFKAIKAAFYERGIHVRRGVDALLHRYLGLKPEHYPVSEACYEETVCLPLYPALEDSEIWHIIEACHRIFN